MSAAEFVLMKSTSTLAATEGLARSSGMLVRIFRCLLDREAFNGAASQSLGFRGSLSGLRTRRI
jgi:hypothetical protein